MVENMKGEGLQVGVVLGPMGVDSAVVKVGVDRLKGRTVLHQGLELWLFYHRTLTQSRLQTWRLVETYSATITILPQEWIPPRYVLIGSPRDAYFGSFRPRSGRTGGRGIGPLLELEVVV